MITGNNDRHTELLRIIAEAKKMPSWIGKAVAIDGFFPDFESAIHHAVENALIPVFQPDEDIMIEALQHVGFDFRYNIVADDVEANHPFLTGGQWKPVRKKSNQVALLSRVLHQICCTVQMVGKQGYAVRRIEMNLWGATTESILGNLRKLVVEDGNGQIPTVHPLRECLNEVREYRDSLTPEQLEKTKRLAKTWLNEMPHLRPINGEIGDAASLNIACGLAYRLLESEKPHGYRPMAQRELVFLASPREWKIGKTAAMVSLIPPTLIGRVLENFTLDSDQKMLRSVKGKFFVIADDLNGFTAKQAEQWKAFQTLTRPSVDDKFKDIKEFPRTDWVAGTANGMFIPPDQALNSRIIVCEVAACKESKSVPAKQRGIEISQWFDKYRMALFAGAVTLAEDDVDIEAPDAIWGERRDAIETTMTHNDDLRDAIKRYINEECSDMHGFFRMKKLLHDLHYLAYQSGDDKGKVIGRTEGTEDEVDTAYLHLVGKNPPEYRAVVNILEGLGWRSKKKIAAGKKFNVIAPASEKSYRPWSKKGA